MTQELDDAEARLENAKAALRNARVQFDYHKAAYHMKLIARRANGENLTVADISALKKAAVNDVPEVRDAYLAFVQADSEYRAAKVSLAHHVRAYWEGRGK